MRQMDKTLFGARNNTKNILRQMDKILFTARYFVVIIYAFYNKKHGAVCRLKLSHLLDE